MNITEIECGGTGSGLEVAGDGGRFTKLTLEDQLVLLTLDAMGEPLLERPVAADAGTEGLLRMIGGEPALLVAQPSMLTLHQRNGGSWQAHELPTQGRTLDARQDSTGGLHLFTHTAGATAEEGVLRHVAPDQQVTTIAEGEVEGAVATLLPSGEPVLAFIQPVGLGSVSPGGQSRTYSVMRWTPSAGLTTVSAFSSSSMSEWAPPPLPQVELIAHDLGEDGVLLGVLHGGRVTVYGPTVSAMFAGDAQPARSCNGTLTVSYPDNCPSDQVTYELGHQYVQQRLGVDAEGHAWLLTLSGSLRLTCTWSGGCLETLPCDCRQSGVPSAGPLRLRLVDLAQPERRFELDLGMSRGGTLQVAPSSRGLLVTVMWWPDSQSTRLRRYNIPLPAVR